MSASEIAALLPLSIAVPIAGAVIAPLVARVSRRLPIAVSLTSLAGSGAILIATAPRVYGGELIAQYVGHWAPVGGASLGIALAADPFGLTFALATAGIGAVLLLSAASELGGLGRREMGGLACLFQLLLAALIGSALSADLFNLFVWFEVAALASYGLTGFFLERPIALEAAFKIIVLTTLASFAVFVATAILYRDHGALNMGQLHGALSARPLTPDRVALGLLVAGYATKAGLLPFHGWLADAHTAAPGPVSALFSGLMVNLGIVAIGRLVLQVFPADASGHVLGFLMAAGVVSAIVGAVMALAQDDLKRLLAFDTISQMGVLAVAMATASTDGAAGLTYQLVNHALFKSLLFLCAGAIVHATGATRLSELGGLGRQRPMLAIAFTAGVLAIAGVPPFNGYASLGLIHTALQDGGPALVLFGSLIAQVVTVAALGRAAYAIFWRPRSSPYEHLEPLKPGMIVALTMFAAACLVFGLLPGAILHTVVSPAASALTQHQVFAHGVLNGTGVFAPTAVTFRYFDPKELLTAAVLVVLGIWLALRSQDAIRSLPVRMLRAVHNGSVNDYAALATVGLLVAVAAVAI